MNQLKVNLQHAIIVLAEGGTSGRDIARELGIDRGTVAKYLYPTGKSTGGWPKQVKFAAAIS